MLLQSRLEEIDSAIIDVYVDRIIVRGFYSEERLLDYYIHKKDCWCSLGKYPKENYDIAYLKNNALLIILKDGEEISKHKFELLKKDTAKYKDINDDNKVKSKTYEIRYCFHSRKYNYKDADISLIFNTYQELKNYFFNHYNSSLIVEHVATNKYLEGLL